MSDDQIVDKTAVDQLLEQIKAVRDQLLAHPDVPADFKQVLRGEQGAEAV